MSIALDDESKELEIQQHTSFINKSNDDLNEVYFHNWANAYKDKNTPLAKRFIENYSKSFHFTNEKNRGRTSIKDITINNSIVVWEITEKNPDILKVNLSSRLKPGDTVHISSTYSVKIPNDKFTKYGRNNTTYNLRYWYLSPAIYSDNWHLQNNLNIDDLYIDYTNYEIDLTVPSQFVVNSNLTGYVKKQDSLKIYTLKGKQQVDIELNICNRK